MDVRKLLIAALAIVSLPAAADFVTVARAYEIALNNLVVPVTRNGTVTFRTCEECESKVVRMTQDTLFLVNGQRVELKEFRKQVLHVRDRAGETIIVKHHLENNTITSLSVTL